MQTLSHCTNLLNITSCSQNFSSFIHSDTSVVCEKVIIVSCRPYCRFAARCNVTRRIQVNTGICLCLAENSLPKPKSLDTKVSHLVLPNKSGERECSGIPSSSPSSSSTSSSLTTPKEHKSAPVIVPLIKPSAGSRL